jgi:beta-glucosidase/6-phospho-beta-glucosidase/beta-galactosidase
MSEFIFATGIECSVPTIEGGRWRRDQLAETEHYRYWRKDLELTRSLGLKYLRYGFPIHLTFLGEAKYDWSFSDAVCQGMIELGIIPIIDLVHFGLPDWLENFQNPTAPELLADYAGAFAERYPWIRFYTPVNEIYVTAKMSTLEGAWNEQIKTEGAYVTATKHLAKASQLMMTAVLKARPDAVFINSESSEFYQPCCPDKDIQRIAWFENQRRFLATDLLYSHEVEPDVRSYLRDNGLTDEEYSWFMNNTPAQRSVLGVDYYEWNEKLINSDGRPERLGELFGWYVVTQQYYDRYRLPLMHTETNTPDSAEAPNWLLRQWHNVQLIRKGGVPVIGFTWYSLQDQVDWNIGLSEALGNVFPVGLFDLNREPRAVAQAYKYLVEMYADSVTLSDIEKEVIM